ncbi:OLC1v1006633C2 [Oldenlandia corymbosa var. corymbosa]|uniref:OLC1v1006633C2 n=1 Tax=Oldenlandia corymbosa var. corymbosa TaxID=529605 RepID=A0AAV1DKU8_OLDCO|nr:OLC1v1006633C2 [Oldenlandia corymbosa var. corymbosa]
MDSEQAQKEIQVPFSKYSKRVILKDIVGRSDGGVGLIGQRVLVGGWVKSSREIKKDLPPSSPSPNTTPDAVGPKDVRCVEYFQSVPFLKSIVKVLGGGDHRSRSKLDSLTPKRVKPPQPTISLLQITDGSCIPTLQVSVDSALALPSLVMPTGACILAEGVLQQPSIQGKQVLELKVEKVLHVGGVDEDKYPLSKKRLPLEMLRDRPHFRPRTTTVASVTRINSALTQASHVFCQNHGFVYVQVPIITHMDMEGSDKMFQVTTLLNSQETRGQNPADNVAGVSLETIKASLKEKSNRVEELKRSESNKEAAAAAIQDLRKTTELVAQLEAREKAKSGHSFKAKKLNFSDDFFSKPAYLTVSGRLHLESYACALGNVYSFGPRFRAEQSQSRRSLAEMWMLEIEMAFSELEDAMDCASDFLKFICKWIVDNCNDDLKFVTKRIDKTVEDRLKLMVSGSLEKISYADAVEVLKRVTQKKFEVKVEYGVSLTEEHESYLADVVYEKPVIVYNQPKALKPFNVRLNDDGKTVSSFDVILPKVRSSIRPLDDTTICGMQLNYFYKIYAL